MEEKFIELTLIDEREMKMSLRKDNIAGIVGNGDGGCYIYLAACPGPFEVKESYSYVRKHLYSVK